MTDDIETLKRKAARYDWLTKGKRDDYIWNHVLFDEHRELGDFVDECIDKAIEKGMR